MQALPCNHYGTLANDIDLMGKGLKGRLCAYSLEGMQVLHTDEHAHCYKGADLNYITARCTLCICMETYKHN